MIIPKDTKEDTLLESALDYATFESTGQGLTSAIRLAPHGRLDVDIKLKEDLPDLPEDHAPDVVEVGIDENWKNFPRMSILCMIVGSRG